MIGFDILRGQRLALATEDPFTPLYLAQALPLWGIQVLGPMRNAAELIHRLESDERATSALISVNLPGMDDDVHRLLLEKSMPYLMFGVPLTPQALNSASRMLSPVTAFQIADELAALLSI